MAFRASSIAWLILWAFCMGCESSPGMSSSDESVERGKSTRTPVPDSLLFGSFQGRDWKVETVKHQTSLDSERRWGIRIYGAKVSANDDLGGVPCLTVYVPKVQGTHNSVHVAFSDGKVGDTMTYNVNDASVVVRHEKDSIWVHLLTAYDGVFSIQGVFRFRSPPDTPVASSDAPEVLAIPPKITRKASTSLDNQQVAQDLAEKLSHANISYYDLAIFFKQGHVTLEGSVLTANDVQRVVGILESDSRVHEIDNRLTVGSAEKDTAPTE